MNNDKRIIDIICNSLLPLAFLFLVVICIIIFFTIPVHAAAGENSPYFPMGQNDNNIFTEALMNKIDTQFNTTDNYVFVAYSNYQQSVNRYNFFFIRFPKTNKGMFYGEVNNNGYQFSLYKAGSGTFYQGSFWVSSLTNPTINGVSTGTNGALGNFQNLNSSLYSSNKSYVSNFKIWSSNSDDRFVILNYGSTSNGGHAIPPDKHRYEYDTGETAPDVVPTAPTINYYSWTTYAPPSIDTSTMETLLESLIDRVSYNNTYLTNNLSGAFANLIDNIKDFFSYLGSTIQYYGNLIVDNLTSFMDNFFDNMTSLVQPIYEKVVDFVDYIKEPVDKQAIETALEGTTLYSVSNIGSSIKSIFSDYFDSIPQPDTLVFTVPYTILTKSGNIIVDFSWYANIRSSIVPWIVGFLYAGFGLAFFRSIPSIIHGVSGVLQKGG